MPGGELGQSSHEIVEIHLWGILRRVGWGKMSMVGQSESDDIFVAELKANELMITGSSVLLSLSQWENKNVDLITMGSLSFGNN